MHFGFIMLLNPGQGLDLVRMHPGLPLSSRNWFGLLWDSRAAAFFLSLARGMLGDVCSRGSSCCQDWLVSRLPAGTSEQFRHLLLLDSGQGQAFAHPRQRHGFRHRCGDGDRLG